MTDENTANLKTRIAALFNPNGSIDLDAFNSASLDFWIDWFNKRFTGKDPIGYASEEQGSGSDWPNAAYIEYSRILNYVFETHIDTSKGIETFTAAVSKYISSLDANNDHYKISNILQLICCSHIFANDPYIYSDQIADTLAGWLENKAIDKDYRRSALNALGGFVATLGKKCELLEENLWIHKFSNIEIIFKKESQSNPIQTVKYKGRTVYTAGDFSH